MKQMKKAIIYTRVSTEEQNEKGYSLADQEEKLRIYCKNHEIEIVQHFQDAHSAKTFDRPEFNNLIHFINKNKGLVNTLLVVKWDRFSRNLEGSLTMISYLVKLGVSVEALEQPIDDSVPENLLMKAFYLAAPQVENQRRSMNTTNGMRKAQKEGRYVSLAPYGYANARDAMNKPCIVPSKLAPLIKKSFELCATGTYQTEILRREMFVKGLRISSSQFSQMLRNPIYCGKIRVKAYKNEPAEIYQGLHEAIISEELFLEVQKVLNNKQKIKLKQSKINSQYPLRGYIQCSKCGKVLTGSSVIGNGGRYYYYHCIKGCRERFETTKLHNAFDNWLSSISLKPEIGALYQAVMEDIYKTKEGDRNIEIMKLKEKITANEELIDKATLKLINEDIDKNAYNRLKEKSIKEINDLKAHIADLKKIESGFVTYCKYGFTLLSNLNYYYNTATLENKHKMIGLIFPEKLIFEKNTFQTTKPNEILSLIFNTSKDSRILKNKKSSKKAAHSYVVTPTADTLELKYNIKNKKVNTKLRYIEFKK